MCTFWIPSTSLLLQNMWTSDHLKCSLFIYLSASVGFSAGSDRSVSILGLLGACTVCRCNQRHSPWEMAVFLTCLFFWTGTEKRSQWKMELESTVRNLLEYIQRKQTETPWGLINMVFRLKVHYGSVTILSPADRSRFSANPRGKMIKQLYRNC